jgi:RNA polymerase sigma-70 factor (ECF subfamily)
MYGSTWRYPLASDNIATYVLRYRIHSQGNAVGGLHSHRTALAVTSIAERERIVPNLDLSAAYVAHAPKLRVYILARVGDQDITDDLLSQVFECACRQANRYEDRGFAVSAWLYRIAQSRIVDHYRVVRRRGYDSSLDDCVVSDDGGMQALESRLSAAPLVEAIGQLATEQRRVIVLRFVLDRRLSEVAAQLGVSTGAVKALQHRALDRLRTILTPPDAPIMPVPESRRCRECGRIVKAGGLCDRHYMQRQRRQKKERLTRWEHRAAEDDDEAPGAKGSRRAGRARSRSR